MKHPHHDVIVAYLEGKTVQRDNSLADGGWDDFSMSSTGELLLPTFHPGDRWRIKPVVVRRWYVHDLFDTLTEFDTAAEAARAADRAAKDECVGVHIIYATAEENAEYCNTGRFPFSSK